MIRKVCNYENTKNIVSPERLIINMFLFKKAIDF